ncbi:RHS repeat-associated core domain-containing protein, partial [bacterium]|nr:RHS repeat-associated core domain-containing protein [bacterium]
SSIASADYTLDPAGNRLTRTDASGTQTFTYDSLNRLATATGPGTASDTYTYDAFGNRTQLVDGSGTTTTAYNAGDEITSMTPPSPGSAVTYTYDANGNLTARGSDTFSWDYENRLTSATVGGTPTTYTYSGDGLRQSATTGGTTTDYTWDINRSLPEVLSDGTSQYIYGLRGTPLAQVSATGTVHYLTDGLGSTMATTDASGNVVNTYAYDPYGATTSSTGSQPNAYQFAGQATDSTGLQYLRARYYDAATGTFISSDPMGVSPIWPGNPYGYANGNPALLTDPYGLFCVGPLCVSSHDVTLGGHSAKKGIANLAGSASDFIRRPSTLISISQTAAIPAAILGCAGAAESGGLLVPVCVTALGLVYVTTKDKVAAAGSAFVNGTTGPVEAACKMATAGPGQLFNLRPFVGTGLCKLAAGIDGALHLSPQSGFNIGEKQQ